MDYLKICFSHTLEQIIILAVPTIVIAFVMNLIATKNWGYGDRLIGRWAFSVFTALGTMIHEISHAAACVVFRHEIKEVALFKPDPEDGSLGYVTHSYDRNNFYQRMGNLPIGVAPIIGGSLALGLVLILLGDGSALKTVLREPAVGQGPVDMLLRAMDIAWDAVVLIVKRNRVFSLKTVVFFYLTFCIGTNISLSKADMQGALPAIPFCLGTLLGINVLTAWIPGYPKAVAWVTAVGAGCLGLLSLVLVINLVTLGMLWGIARLLGRD